MNDKQSLKIGMIALLFIFLSFSVIQYAMSNLNDTYQRWSKVKTILDFRGLVMPSFDKASKQRIRLLDTPIILIEKEINSGRAIQIIQEIKRADADVKTKEIYVRLVADGKDMSAVLAIYHTIKQCHKPVNIIADAALSGAALILASGTPGKRSITQNAVIVIEQPVFKQGYGKFRKFLTESFYLRLSFLNFRNNWLNLLAKNTQQPIKLISKLNCQARTLSAEEVIKYGFADQIIRDERDDENNKDSKNEQ